MTKRKADKPLAYDESSERALRAAIKRKADGRDEATTGAHFQPCDAQGHPLSERNDPLADALLKCTDGMLTRNES